MKAMQDYRILRPKEAAAKLGVSRVTLWRFAQKPDFPNKVRLGTHAVGFRSDELDAYVQRQQQGE